MRSKLALCLADAKAIAEAAERHAEHHALRVTIAVCDDGGHLLILRRHEEASPASVANAIAKCSASAVTRRETRIFQDLINQQNLAFVTMPVGGFVEGAVPLVVDGQHVGAIGVSGAPSVRDAEVARAGAAALNEMTGRSLAE